MKKNLRFKQKNWKPTQQQTIGIIWISVALLLIIGLGIFLPKREKTVVVPTEKLDTTMQNLSISEDSVYRTRRTNKPWFKTQERDIPRPATEKPTPSATPHFEQPYERATLEVELNEADSLTLQLLRGVGPARARAIVRYRERIGGFVKIDQLLEVWGMDSALLGSLSKHLRIDTSLVVRIAINKATLKQLTRHPYMDFYLARDIVALRQQGMTIQSATDLRALPSCDSAMLSRLLPYLDFETGQ